ncbi:MAG: hypothetical protein EBU03_02905 [Methylophilaceae bacterium]|nr:hypothetical protein [Methylophilaceae bacterium]
MGKICFIGGGNMARALIGGLKNNGYLMSDINVIEPDAEKRAALSADFGVSVTEQLPSVAMADIVVLAVKPQQLRDLSIFLGSLLQKQLLISIAAGIRAKDIARWLGGYQAIIRVMPNTPAQIQAGKLRALATTGPNRTRLVANGSLPTMAEFKDMESFNVLAWYGFMAPAGTPAPIVDRLSREIGEVLRLPEVTQRLNTMGFEVVGTTPDAFSTHIRTDVAKWAKLVKDSGAKLD